MTVPVVESYSSVGTASASTSVSVTKPTGTAEDDLLFARIAGYVSSDPSFAASGWTQLGSTLAASGYWATSVWYKVAGGSEPSSYTFSWSGSFIHAIGISRISGANTSSPIDDYDMGSVESGAATGTCPDITTTVDDCLILRSLCKARHENLTGPAGHTVQYDVDCGGFGAAPTVGLAYEEQASAGSPGTADFTWTPSVPWNGATVAIAPAGGGGSDPVVQPAIMFGCAL